MKKKYIKPEMKVYEIETPQLLAGSGEESGMSYYGSECPDDLNEGMW